MLKNPVDYIVPLNMNGLQGRMLRLPAHRKSNKEILVIYGHHAMLERWWGLAENLNQYGNVTMPDLPGFGGMDSFAKIGDKPSIDNFADYLASFIKLRYRNRRFKIVGISWGFVVVTRMLQRYPELVKRIDLLVSATGFAHYDDFQYSTFRRRSYRVATRLVAIRPIAFIFRVLCLNQFVIRQAYAHTYNGRHKFKDLDDPSRFNKLMDMETRLWSANDVTTHMLTACEFLGLNNCRLQIDVPIEHICSTNDHYFENDMVTQHLQIIYRQVFIHEVDLEQHISSVIADKKEASYLLPKAVRRKLAQ